MTFAVFYDKQPLKFLESLDEHIRRRLVDKIEQTLSESPVPHGAVAIVGQHGVFRIRIGDHRALYRINHPEHKVIVVVIDKRSRVYD